MEKNPRVSVIIPVYNRAFLIRRALQSVLNQTYRDFEIIVVNDGSTDNLEDTVKSFKDDRIRYFQHNKNRGAPAARNTGIRAAKGEYIAFQDSDDEWLPEKLEKQIIAFENAKPAVGVVYSGFWLIKNDKRTYMPTKETLQKEGNIHNELLKGNFVSGVSAIVRRNCFEKTGMFDENVPRLQDWELFIRLSKHYEFKYINQPLVLAYSTSESISGKNDNIPKAQEIILAKHFEDFRTHRRLLAEYYFGLFLYYFPRQHKKGNYYLRVAVKLNPLKTISLFRRLPFVVTALIEGHITPDLER